MAVLVIAASTCSPAAAALQPIDLRVEGGEESWHAETSFALRWSNPPELVTAAHYRVLDSAGRQVIEGRRLPWAATAIPHLTVPSIPDAYTVLVWLEGGGGMEGMPAEATLRFDNAPPGHVEPVPVDGWIGRSEFPYSLRIGHPDGAEPISGIRGYAVSVGTTPAGLPCLGAYTCSEQEIDLRGGVSDDSLLLADLPEGRSYVQALAVSGSGVRSRAAGTSVLDVDKTDPTTQLTGVPTGWTSHPVRLTATAVDEGSGMVASAGRGPFTAIRVGAGAPVIASGSSVTTTVIESGIHRVAFYARDAAGNVNDGAVAGGRANRAPLTALVRIDRDPPALAFAAAQDPADPERIEVDASDARSGIDPQRGTIAVRRSDSEERFRPLATQAGDDGLRARWDSDAYPPGEYEFRAVAFDRAGNSATTLDRGGGGPMRLHNPLKVATTLRAALSQGDRRLRGRLIAGRRVPLAGMAVQVVERFDEGAELHERVSIARTGPDGAFTARLRPGPSRQVFAVAPATATLRGASSETLRLKARSTVRMRASSSVARVGGPPIVFRGTVAGRHAQIPRTGKAVQLQFRLPGLEWSEFRTLRTDARGRFHYAYRFVDDDSRGARFQFRAFAPAEAGWPFEPAGSRPVAVLGR